MLGRHIKLFIFLKKLDIEVNGNSGRTRTTTHCCGGFWKYSVYFYLLISMDYMWKIWLYLIFIH